MYDSPPNWLKVVVEEHRPIVGFNDIACSCSSDYEMTVWTPEHMTRAIHARLGELLEQFMEVAVAHGK